jgi:L-lactate utilization protein LutC
MNVGQVNDEGVPYDKEVNTRLSSVCGLAARQRVSLTMQRFEDLTDNEKDDLFKNSIQSYIQYSEELKQKGKNVAMKIIFHAWRTYKSSLVKLWRKNESPFIKYNALREEDWTRFVAKCESENFAVNS